MAYPRKEKAQIAPDGLPLPSKKLIFDVAGSEDADWFLKAGKMGQEAISEMMERHHIRISEMTAVLDFGCGVGRVLRHFAHITGPQYHGTDYNPALIQWAKQNLKFASFKVNKFMDRLDYADGQFDLVYALSVFTHLTEEQGLFWIKELTRVTKPGGCLYITTHGKKHYWPHVGLDDRPRFRRGELVVYSTEKAGQNECAAFHPKRYVRKVLARGLKVIDYQSQGARGNPLQDAWLIQKPKIQ